MNRMTIKKIILALVCVLVVGVLYFVISVNKAHDVSGGVITLEVGEIQTVGTITIRLDDVSQDYRCPIDVQCIQAGAIVANVSMRSGKQSETRIFPSDEVPYIFAGHTVAISAVAPPARSSRTFIPKEEYKVTFTVALIEGIEGEGQ